MNLTFQITRALYKQIIIPEVTNKSFSRSYYLNEFDLIFNIFNCAKSNNTVLPENTKHTKN